MSYLKKCPGCKKNFRPLRSNQRWCSVTCRARTKHAAIRCRWSALTGNISTGCGEFITILTGVPRVCPFCARSLSIA